MDILLGKLERLDGDAIVLRGVALLFVCHMSAEGHNLALYVRAHLWCDDSSVSSSYCSRIVIEAV
jgi:hypothetical protein